MMIADILQHSFFFLRLCGQVYETMVLKISNQNLDFPVQVHCGVTVILSLVVRGSSPWQGFHLGLFGWEVQRSGITNTDLYKVVFRCFLVVAFSIIEIPFVVNEQSESSVYLHDPCPSMKTSFVYQGMYKKHESKLVNFGSLLSGHTEYDNLHLN